MVSKPADKERRVHRADRLPNFVRQVGGGGRIAPVETVGQQIIFADDAFGDAERVQDQRAGKAGAVLAGRAVNHDRTFAIDEMREQLAETVGVEPDIAAIGLAHDVERIG